MAFFNDVRSDAFRQQQTRSHIVKFMQSVRSPAFALFALAALGAGPVSAEQVKSGDLVLDHAWTRATPAGATVGAGYLTIENKGATPDRLVGASTPAAARVEVHEMTMNNGVMKMRPVEGGLSIPAGQSVTLAPGGYHIMLMGLKTPLKEGEKVPLTLQFDKAGKVDVTLDVQGVGAQQPGDTSMPPDTGHMNKM
jgi:periplasmic copper chaperone A